MIKIAPSILSADFANMAADVKNIALWGADIVHCDVMDGVFVPNLTFGMPMVKAIRKVTELPLDVHLMIVEPEKYAFQFVSAGADIVTFHPEASKDPVALLKALHTAGVKTGFVLNPDVPFELWVHLAEYSDVIVVMSVYAGFGGQKLIPECVEKLKNIKMQLTEKYPAMIYEIDGGITADNAALAVAAGADWLVAGSAVFGSADPKATILKMKS